MEKNEYYTMYRLETEFWWYRVLHELVSSIIKKNKPDRQTLIFDAGCGTGRMMEICSEYGTVCGIDFSADAVHLAKKRGISNVEIGDLNEFPPQKNSFDIIISLDVLCHEGIRNDTEIIQKFFYSLKEDGLLILNLPAFESLRRWHDVVVHTKKRYRKREFVAQLKKTCFSEIRATYRMPHLLCIILLSKLTGKTGKQQSSESDLKAIPSWLNQFLLILGRIENFMIKSGLNIPFGSSLFVVARKKSRQN